MPFRRQTTIGENPLDADAARPIFRPIRASGSEDTGAEDEQNGVAELESFQSLETYSSTVGAFVGLRRWVSFRIPIAV